MSEKYQNTEKADHKCFNKSRTQFTVTIDGQTYPKSILNIHNELIDLSCLKNSKKDKQILIWNNFFGVEFEKSSCPVKSCDFTRNRSNIDEADLVLVSMLDTVDILPGLPNYQRPPYQRWVFAVYESPINSVDFSQYNGYFNLTSTYRHKTDYPGIYQSSSSMNIHSCWFVFL